MKEFKKDAKKNDQLKKAQLTINNPAEKVWEYKGTRYGHVSLYNVYDIDGKLLYERVTLDTLRRVLTIEGFTI